jgi:hypothetical protein
MVGPGAFGVIIFSYFSRAPPFLRSSVGRTWPNALFFALAHPAQWRVMVVIQVDMVLRSFMIALAR